MHSTSWLALSICEYFTIDIVIATFFSLSKMDTSWWYHLSVDTIYVYIYYPRHNFLFDWWHWSSDVKCFGLEKSPQETRSFHPLLLRWEICGRGYLWFSRWWVLQLWRPHEEQNASDLHLDSWNPRLPRQPSCHNMANNW